MTTRLTLFKATLIQDSALSVSGIDRESTADRPFALVNGVPTLSGRGLKGAAVAMARRFFCPLPRSISEDPPAKGSSSKAAYRRSAWEFQNAIPEHMPARTSLRAGVGIRHKTGARAGGVLYDMEVMPAGTRWPLVMRVDWSLAGAEASEAEGILGYVLAHHWREERCWLGGGVARGLGWCHIDGLHVYQLDAEAYDRWVENGRSLAADALPEPLAATPTVEPTQSWCFRTLDVKLKFGEYRPDGANSPWGVDMLAIGPHDSQRTTQDTGYSAGGSWARPPWALDTNPKPDALSTQRALSMDAGRPLLPGSSLRGPLRHAFARAMNAAVAGSIEDPHPVQGRVDSADEGGKLFGTVVTSSRVLIRDGAAEGEWAAARLQMHAEDEFSAGSFESAKRDAVRLLNGVFPMRIVVEGRDAASVTSMAEKIDRLVALGEVGHLPVGGHKTRGAGWSRWEAPPQWTVVDIHKQRCWAPAVEATTQSPTTNRRSGGTKPDEDVHVLRAPKALGASSLTLGEAAKMARPALGEAALVAWWCDPTIDLERPTPPAVFGRHWPDASTLWIDEVAFFADRAVWRAVRTADGIKSVLIAEVGPNQRDAIHANVVHTPARLHNDGTRFSGNRTGEGELFLREWHIDGQCLGFTMVWGKS